MQLLPRNEKFFELLLDHARIVLDASGVLANCLNDGNQASGSARQVRDLEHQGDAALRKIYRLLHKVSLRQSTRKTFITSRH
jgi:hypothetical protein